MVLVSANGEKKLHPKIPNDFQVPAHCIHVNLLWIPVHHLTDYEWEYKLNNSRFLFSFVKSKVDFVHWLFTKSFFHPIKMRPKRMDRLRFVHILSGATQRKIVFDQNFTVMTKLLHTGKTFKSNWIKLQHGKCQPLSSLWNPFKSNWKLCDILKKFSSIEAV